jgi:hypothetical protein
MNIYRRILAGLTFLVCLAMLLLSLVGAVGVWMIKDPVTAKANRVFWKIETSLNIAGENLDQDKASLARAADRLDSARTEQRRIAQQRQPNGTVRSLLRIFSIVPQFDNVSCLVLVEAVVGREQPPAMMT